MDTKALTLLVEILDAGNLSEAARRLKMTRANVSYHLTQLERAVGMQLLRRTTRHVEPTEIGLKLYQHGRSIQDELAAAREAVESLGKTPQGKVRLSVPSGYGQFVMTPWLLEFKRAYPDIVLDVLFENSVDDLLRDEVDIAVRIMSEPPHNLVARELGQVRYVACASPAFVRERACRTSRPTWRACRSSAPPSSAGRCGCRRITAGSRASTWCWSPPSSRATTPSCATPCWPGWASAWCRTTWCTTTSRAAPWSPPCRNGGSASSVAPCTCCTCPTATIRAPSP